VSTRDPGEATAEALSRFEMRYPEATCGVSSNMRIASDADAYSIELDLTVTEDGETRWTRRWERRIPRDLT
jgi:hypothetical protein